MTTATPASFVQRSMWAAATRLRGAPLDVFVLRWLLDGLLDEECLIDSLHTLVERHPTLRSVLVNQANQLMQVPQDAQSVPVERAVAVGSGPTQRLNWALAHARQLSEALVDMARGPLARWVLVRVDERRCLLGLVVHHAVCDGWSAQVLASELVALYAGKRRGQSVDLPAIQEQASDFASVQLEANVSGGYEEELAFWRDELAHLPPPLALPLMRSRKGLRDPSCAYPNICDSREVLDALRAQARSLGVTVFALLSASLAVALHGRTGACDLIFGVSTLNRWSASALRFVGCATNLLPLRIRIDPVVPFYTLASQVQTSIRKLLAYGRVPLELILREIGKSKMGEALEMPIWCQYREAAPLLAVEDSGLEIVTLPIERPTLSCDLEVDWLGTDEGLRCEYAYRKALFAPATIDSWLDADGALIRAISAGTGQSVDRLAHRTHRARD